MGSHRTPEEKAERAARKAAKKAEKAEKSPKEAKAAPVEAARITKTKSQLKESRESGKKLKKVLASIADTTSATAAAPSGEASSPADIKKFLDDNAVKIETSLPNIEPYLTMAEVPLTEQLASKLTKFAKPTPIQSATWPHLLAGRDVVGVAETGSGKTLAFGVPACQRIILEKWTGVNVLVVSPTRELAMQIDDNLRLLDANAVCVYGGVPKYEQQKILRSRKPNIVVGTPGRLKDLIADGSLPLNNIKYLVLDEADRMLEKGFEDDIREILGQCPSKEQRQTVMFTATWPEQVRELASSFMKDGQVVKVSIGDADELTANKRITQIVEVVDNRYKESRFLELLRKYATGQQKVLIFALYKKEASRIEALLRRKGYHVAAIHGDLSQSQRTEALAAFKSGKANLMLATDVAARGLDIPNVKVVINLTFPLTVEDYVHRIGRTGRAGEFGTAHTLFTDNEKHLAGALMNVLRGANQPVPDELLKFGSHTKKKEHGMYGAFFKEIDPNVKAKKIKFD